MDFNVTHLPETFKTVSQILNGAVLKAADIVDPSVGTSKVLEAFPRLNCHGRMACPQLSWTELTTFKTMDIQDNDLEKPVHEFKNPMRQDMKELHENIPQSANETRSGVRCLNNCDIHLHKWINPPMDWLDSFSNLRGTMVAARVDSFGGIPTFARILACYMSSIVVISSISYYLWSGPYWMPLLVPRND